MNTMINNETATTIKTTEEETTMTVNSEMTANNTMTNTEEEITMTVNSEMTTNTTMTNAEEETTMIRFCDVNSSEKAEAFSKQDAMSKLSKLVYSGEGYYAFQLSDALKQILIAQGMDPDKKHTPRTRRTKEQIAADKAAQDAQASQE